MWLILRRLGLMFVLTILLAVPADGCSTVNYTGNVHTTNGGRKCQFWEDQGPHRHTNNKNAMFPYDRNVKAARNHCRNQNGDNRAWCYTTDLYRRWEYCDFVICEDVRQCGGRIYDVSGTISSPDADNSGHYDADKDCLWFLTAEQRKFVQIEFRTFNLQSSSSCELDFLQVYEYNFIHGRYCGRKIPPVITSKSRNLFLRFHSDSIEEATGFTLTFAHVDEGLSKIPRKYVSGELICPRNVDILHYTGKVSSTNSGHDCKMWKDVPNAYDLYFYEAGSAIPERNRCRNINVGSETLSTIFPGCVNAVTGQYEYCQESICENVSNVERKTTMVWSTVDSFPLAFWVSGSAPVFPTTTKAPMTNTAVILTSELTTGGRNMSTVNMTKASASLIYATLPPMIVDTTSTAELTTGRRNVSTTLMTTIVENQTTLQINITEQPTKQLTLKESTCLKLTTVDENNSTDSTVTKDSEEGRLSTENLPSGVESVFFPEAITFTLVLLTVPIIN